MKHRETLKKHCGQEVWVIGTYVGPAKKNEIPHKIDCVTNTRENETKFLFTEISKIQPDKKRLFSQIDETSCIVDVKGCNGFDDISEKHIVLQSNISDNGKIVENDNVIIHGTVTEYKRKNGSIDYAIDARSYYKC